MSPSRCSERGNSKKRNFLFGRALFRNFSRTRKGFFLLGIGLAMVLASLFPLSEAAFARQEYVPLRQEAFRNSLPEELVAWLEKHATSPFRLGVLRNWAPFMIEKDRVMEGFSLEYLEGLGDLMGVSFSFVVADSWEELLELLRKDKVDLLPAVWNLPEREKDMLFTRPYYEGSVALARFTGEERGKKNEAPELPLAVIRKYGTAGILERQYPRIPRIYVASPLEALETVSRGKARGYLDQKEILEYLLGTWLLPNLRVENVGDTPFLPLGRICMGVRRDWPELVAILDRAMENVTDEEYANLRHLWLELPLKNLSLPDLTEEEKAWMEARLPLRTVLLSEDMPPFWIWGSREIPRGYAVQLLQKIQEELKLPLLLLPEPAAGGEATLREKSGDLLPLIQPLRAREEGFLYSTPYLSVPTVIVTADSAREVRSLSDTKNMIVAADSSLGLQTFFSRGHPFSERKEYASAEEALLAVSRREADCYIGNLATVSSIIKKNRLRNLRVISDPTLPPLFLSFGIREDYGVLENILNRCVEKIDETRKYALLQEHFDSEINTSFRLFPHEREWLESLGPLRIGIDPDWPPLEFLGEEGLHEGIISDYLALIQKDLRISLDYVGTRSWSDTMEKAARGELDLVPGLNDLPQRRAFLTFTEPYIRMPLVIAARKDAGYIGGLDSLRGKSAGVVEGYAVNHILFQEYPDIRFVTFPNIKEALEALERRQIHSVIQSNLVLSYYMKFLGLDSLQIVAPTPFEDLLSMGVRRELAPLVPILNRLLGSITENEKDLILDKWITRPIPGYLDWQKIWRVFFAVFGVGFLFVAFMLFWNRKLAREVAERQKVEHKLEEQKIHAESANRAKSVFLANMSHEIRTPLNAILGYAQLMKRDSSLSANQREFVETIHQSGDHLLHLISDILEMSKIEAGRVDLEGTPFDLHEMISHLQKLFSVEVERKGISMEICKSPYVPRYLFGDEKKVRQVLLNILGNAVKFTARGRILFKVQSESSGARQRRIILEVRDSGPGIPEGDLEKIFEPFEQTREGIEKGGTGLGLPISRHYARLMGGDLQLQNVPAGGALCLFTFLADEVEALKGETFLPLSSAPVLRLLSPEKPPLLLVVDDRKSNRKLLRHLLEDVGFRIEEAEDGQKALDFLEHTQPQGILLDRRMPGLDGLEVLQRVKESPQTAHIPIIMVSASVMEEDRHEVLRKGADAFIRKPFKEEELLESLGLLLDVRYSYGLPSSAEVEASPSKTEEEPALAPETLDRMYGALRSGEVSKLEDLIEREISPVSPKLGEILQRLLKNYEYEAMEDLLEKMERETPETAEGES